MSLRGAQAFRSVVSLLVVLAAAGMGLWTLEAPSAATGLLRVTFIEVGQGDAAWLSTPDGWDILIDGGMQSHGPGLVAYLQGLRRDSEFGTNCRRPYSDLCSRGGSKLKEHDHFAQMLEELAPLLSELPRGASQEIVRSLTGIARLLDDLDVAKAELERKCALLEAEEIIAGGWRDTA